MLDIVITVADPEEGKEQAVHIRLEVSDLGVHVHVHEIVGDPVLLTEELVDQIGRLFSRALGTV